MFSVLMSVYKNENALFFYDAVHSVIQQTLQPNEVVIVKDGPLTEELNETLTTLQQEHPHLIKQISLKDNQGLGKALNIGLMHCHHPLVARMDTDDVADPRRFEKQILYLQEHPNIAVLGSWIAEFEHDISSIHSIRGVPDAPDKIKHFIKHRNPLNHMTVMFKKEVVESVGGYRHLLWNEDYYLWARILAKGYHIANLTDPLVYVRANREMYSRRGGVGYIKNEVMMQNKLKELNLITWLEYIRNITLRASVRLFPNYIRELVYRRYLRVNAFRQKQPEGLTK